MPVLFRRRTILLPTMTGLLFMVFVIGLSAYLFVQNVAVFLTVNEPVDANYLVAEGWLGKDELKQVLTTFRARDYKKIIVTGGPVMNGFNEHYQTYAERASTYLKSIGVPEDIMIVVASPYSAQDRTFLSAVLVREWFESQRIALGSINVFSGDVHSRRTRLLYQLAFGEQVDIGIYASSPNKFDLKKWWQSSEAVAKVAKELIGLVSVSCCFNPGKKGSHSEKWGFYEK